MTWRCERDCGAGDTKVYAPAQDAARYAAAFDREYRSDVGECVPLIGSAPA